jgi:hypothetical protein
MERTRKLQCPADLHQYSENTIPECAHQSRDQRHAKSPIQNNARSSPLSCALFNLAIEQLASKIREDPSLEGLKIPGIEEKIIVTMFADDTNLYLKCDDRMDHVQTILEEWCHASGAKSNIEKTEIIPLGSEAH